MAAGVRRLTAAPAVVLVLGVVLTGCAPREAAFVVGRVVATPVPAAVPVDEPGPAEAPVPADLVPPPVLARAGSGGPRAAIDFRGAVDVPDDLLFFLVAGSDARPGENVLRSRADSIHVVAVDPVSRRGTVLGIPRDLWVQVPGHGNHKINNAMVLGGPNLLADTVRRVTGLPVSYYAVTGFTGLIAMVDELGGLDVYVPVRMNDSMSGARFEQGWHHMDGTQVLAFTRNRNLSGGDFTRSHNHGRVILHALEKARSVISDQGGLRQWLGILYRHGAVDMGLEDAVGLAGLARSIDPSQVVNVVAPGRTAKAGGQSVVVLEEAAYDLFRDIAADAVADGLQQRPSPTPGPDPTQAPATPDPTPQTGQPAPTPREGLPIG